MVFAIALGVSMILSIPITYIIIHLHATKDRKLIFGDKSQSNEDDNPLLLTIKAMEGELDELRQNNAYLKHIQNLEKQIKEAKAHAEALSKVAGKYGSTMEEVGESIQHTRFTERVDGSTLILSPATDSHEAFDDAKPEQNTAIYRTYTRQAGWSSYYDVTNVRLK